MVLKGWWTIQTAFTVTFEPDPDPTPGRILGSTIILIGIGTIIILISSLAAGLMR